MAFECIKIAKIGERTAFESKSSSAKVFDDIFTYRNSTFKLLIDVDILKVTKDVNVVAAFKLQSITDEQQTESLWLLFDPNLMEVRNRSGRYLKATRNLVETFFIIEQEYLFGETDEEVFQNEVIVDGTTAQPDAELSAEDFDGNNASGGDDDDDDDDSDELPVKIIDELYQQLRESHRHNDALNNYTAEHIQHKDLRPTLTNYQIDGVKWMLDRERVIDYFPTEFTEVIRRWPPTVDCLTTFFYNDRTMILIVNRNEDVAIPTGGILADAMGLGKTVEMLDLILLNPRDIIVPDRSDKEIHSGSGNDNSDCDGDYDIDSDSDSSFDVPLSKRFSNNEQVLRCLCTKKFLTNTVRCTRCFMLQHRLCVVQPNMLAAPDSLYICPTCWQSEPPLPAKTTFIVSPPSIKLQWRDEVIKHIRDDNFKVLVYNGLKNSSWINPMELASYDIILTDYTTLQSEFYYSNYNPTTRTLRRPSRYLNVKTPLLNINWWRVCLDEAQMVSSVITKPARLVAQMTATHRWVVTGTPIQKSIDDLYGLVYFLGCSPYNEREKWIQLISEFNNNVNVRPIVKVLQRIMWRTCKSKEIMDQVNIPEQTELIHYIDMTDLELFYYKKEHERCSADFHRNSIKIGAKQKLATLNPHMLKLVLEPLRKLRQDCSIPSVFDRNVVSGTKKNLKPDELLKHLINKNENEAKSELRTITSCLNGTAALHLIKDEKPEAIKSYRSLLKWAKDYNEKISVDSLLQIHAIHNLLLIDASIGDDERQAYEFDLSKLESKYLEKYLNPVKNYQLEQIKFDDKIEAIYEKFQMNEYQWWVNALKCSELDSDVLVRKIQDEIKTSYNLQDIQFQTVNGLILVLTLWMDKVIEERENVQESFKSLRFYIDNFKAMAEIKPEHRDKMIKFLNHAYECHLKPKKDDEEAEEPKSKRKKFEPCELCLVKEQLQIYESSIIDVSMTNVKIRENMAHHDAYSWKAPYQEAILKIILSHIRNVDIDGKEDGKVLLALLSEFRNECKVYSQLWVEVNYTVSAYDELKMCKSRTQAVDPTELEDVSVMESNLIISEFEVDDNMQHLRDQMREAELNFLRKLGQLKYLNHLKKNKDVEDCPICDTQPENKYVVLECGHHCCMKCFLSWKQSMRKIDLIFKCHICRHQQRIHNLYYVTLHTEEQLTDSSSKFESIVQQIKKLTREDPTVKIVIFSQWSYILGILEAELTLTEIPFRSRLEKFYQTIKEFKDPDMNVTCLLLPLSYGSKGLNLIEATHVFFVEPILDTGEELQAIGRIHRIGQTQKTYVHRFIVRDTVEETIHNTISNDQTGFWSSRKCTVENLMELFRAPDLSSQNARIHCTV